MPVVFRDCTLDGLISLSASAPDGYVIGIVGDADSGQREVLRLAAGIATPAAGAVTQTGPCKLLSPDHALEIGALEIGALDIGDAMTVALDHTLALRDAAGRAKAAMDLELLRRRGGVALFASHELDLVQWLADEVWWFDGGRLAAKGDPHETLDRYRRHVSRRLAEQASGKNVALTPSMRRGDGRAELLTVETLDENLQPAAVWRTGAMALVRVRVGFAADVEDPVIGMMIRTRIGFEVFGTNTELENVKLGPRRAGDRMEVLFRFPCLLCPHEYTLTIASHDPDGVWHDWMEDGVAFSVTDFRYTAGVACLRTSVTSQLLQSE